ERDDVPGVAMGARLGEDARAHFLAGRAQERQSYERIALVERLAQRFGVRHVQCRVPDDLAFRARLLDVGGRCCGTEQQSEKQGALHRGALCYRYPAMKFTLAILTALALSQPALAQRKPTPGSP